MRLHYRGVLHGDALSLDDKRSGTKIFRRCRLKNQVPAFVNGPLCRIPLQFRRLRFLLLRDQGPDCIGCGHMRGLCPLYWLCFLFIFCSFYTLVSYIIYHTSIQMSVSRIQLSTLFVRSGYNFWRLRCRYVLSRRPLETSALGDCTVPADGAGV